MLPETSSNSTTLINLVCILIKWCLFQIGAFAIIPMTKNRIILSVCLLIGGTVFFFIISKTGQKLMQKYELEKGVQKIAKEKSVVSLDISNLSDVQETNNEKDIYWTKMSDTKYKRNKSDIVKHLIFQPWGTVNIWYPIFL